MPLITDPEIIPNEATKYSVVGLKNELTRLHDLHNSLLTGLVGTNAISYGGDQEEFTQEVWNRIVVIQEALLDIARRQGLHPLSPLTKEVP